MNTETQKPDETQAEKPKPSLGARTVLALAFSTIGAKLSIVGTVADASVLMKGENVSFRDKLRGLTDGTLWNRMLHDMEKNMVEANAKTQWQAVKAASKTFKYSIVATVAFMGAGAVLGWVRGARVKSVKDIFVHPIESTKLVLGIGGDKQQEQAEAPVVANDTATQEAEAASTRWRDRASQQKATVVNQTQMGV